MTQTITKMAEDLGVRSDTLRFYERSGLITSTSRTQGGYRLYEDDVADRVRFIKRAQRSGLRLREIAELLNVMDEGNCPCGHTADLVERRLLEVDAELRDLEQLRANLVRLQQDNHACRTSTPTEWSCQITSPSRGGDA
jgi:DNA-binding transcriptional MerR regulator